MESAAHKDTHILILGSGFAAVEVVKKLQKEFHNNKNIRISLVSKDNFLLFTPMLPEVASGMIETRHVVTPVRTFCKKAEFHEGSVESIDLANKKVKMTYTIGRQSRPTEGREHTFEYDYLVIALGNENNFFHNTGIQKNAFTMKSIVDAILLRNHMINLLEQASSEDNKELIKALLTFVVVGGGFNGVETVGAINDFLREAIRRYYKTIYMTQLRVILIHGDDRLLEQIDEELGSFALEKLKESGVEFIMKSLVTEVTANTVKTNNNTIISTYTVVWTAGVTPSKLIAELPCEHDRGHRIIANSYLEVPGYNGVYALGDCASITDPHTGRPYPATAQSALEQGKVAAKNILLAIKGRENKKLKFDYKTRGMMAEIGKRTGVAILYGRIKLHGFVAWWLWRMYYLSSLPTVSKKLKVMVDWTIDFLFKPDVAMIKRTDLTTSDLESLLDEEETTDSIANK
jgi:NADH:ubiquinone reductase (H+-translocating)